VFRTNVFCILIVVALVTTGNVSFGGLVVIVLAIGLSSAGSNPAEYNIFLRAIKIHSTTFFGGKVNPSFPHRKILTEY
jgi:hypothetical protein